MIWVQLGAVKQLQSVGYAGRRLVDKPAGVQVQPRWQHSIVLNSLHWSAVLQDPFIDLEPQFIGEGHLVLSSLANMIDFETTVAVLGVNNVMQGMGVVGACGFSTPSGGFLAVHYATAICAHHVPYGTVVKLSKFLVLKTSFYKVLKLKIFCY